ncbi:phosphoglycerate kinase, partial [bacterium]|nr:phosphoglycerate kinase [bacterium]
KGSLISGEILLLENVRFHKGEATNDIQFAEELAQKCDIFVNDAFSCSHREHASLHAITNFLPSYSGILLNEEITALQSVLSSPSKPVAALVGGTKISTKINIIEYLITKMDYLIIGGGMANTFLVAKGFAVGNSLFEKEAVEVAKSILEQSKKYNCEIILPMDLVVAKKFEANINTQIVSSDMIPSDMMALDIGPKSIDKMNAILKNVKTLLWNGPLGAFEIEPFGKGTFSLAKVASDLTEEGKLITVAGGGDTAFALNKAGVTEKFTYVSSAGGAFLEWLEGVQLPAILVLSNN